MVRMGMGPRSGSAGAPRHRTSLVELYTNWCTACAGFNPGCQLTGLDATHAQPCGGGSEPPVERPELGPRNHRRCQQVDIDPPESATGHPPRVQKLERLRMAHGGDAPKLGQAGKDFTAPAQRPTRQLPDHKLVAVDEIRLEQRTQIAPI